DMVENDSLYSGTISNVYMRGHTLLSERGSPAEAHSVVTVKDSVFELMLQPHTGDHGLVDMNHAAGYPFPDGLGNGSMFKISNGGGTVVMDNVVILVNRPPTSGNSAAKFMPGTYHNVTIVLADSFQGDYPFAPPPGVTITRDRSIYDRAVQAFFDAH